MLNKGCQGYIVHVVLNDTTPSGEEGVRVVRHFRMSSLMICLDYRQIEMWSLPLTYCRYRPYIFDSIWNGSC